ncbi:Protein of unknown function [Pyronema omphalodes CBS 100304]|uniref:Uncharacterized protein n=1 Tax=Pyronema omphalodes (strain CBS 100304) TaxID=1076935 RepID=U4LU02_PYROM|nr:Protein of unknown function [Pyronema omphalodes CBS 100304]
MSTSPSLADFLASQAAQRKIPVSISTFEELVAHLPLATRTLKSAGYTGEIPRVYKGMGFAAACEASVQYEKLIVLGFWITEEMDYAMEYKEMHRLFAILNNEQQEYMTEINKLLKGIHEAREVILKRKEEVGEAWGYLGRGAVRIGHGEDRIGKDMPWRLRYGEGRGIRGCTEEKIWVVSQSLLFDFHPLSSTEI